MWKINKKEIKIRRGREVQQKTQKSISGGGGGAGGGWRTIIWNWRVCYIKT